MSREELCDWTVVELVNRVLHLEALLARVMSGQKPIMCGDILGQDRKTSCQLPIGHDGLHVWASPDADQIVKWA